MLAIADAQGNPHVAAAAGNLILIDVRLSPRLSRHTGPSIERLHAFIAAEGLAARGKHHEIYLNHPGRTAPEKLKAILRQPVG